jgi:hypothetical protein
MRKSYLFCLGLVILLLVGKVGQAQDSLGMSCVSTLDYWSGVYDMQMVDSLAYISSGYSGLRIMDLSDPVNPVELGRSPWSPWNHLQNLGVYVRDSLAYLTYFDEGRVLDISDPTNPMEVNHWYLYYTPIIKFIHGNIAVGVNQEESIPCLMDVSNWNNVQVISNFPGAGSSQPVGMVGNYLCLAGWGVEMYDISDPWNPVLVAVVDDTVYFGWSAKLSGNYVYLSTVFDGVRIYDVSDPLHPVGVAACDSGSCTGITIAASHLFVSKGSWGIDIWNISDPTGPVFSGTYLISLNWQSLIASSGNLFCVALNTSQDQTVATLDISNPASPVEISRFGKRGNLRRVVINETTGYLSDLIAGFHVIDLTYPAQAIELGRPPGFIEFSDIAVRGNYLYGVNYNEGLTTYSITIPTNPESLNCWQNAGNFHPTTITIVGDYAWVNSYIFSLANPASPILIDTSSVTGENFRAANGYVYSAVSRYFFIYNVSNPAMPELIGSCTMPFYWGGIAKDFAIAGDYAYVAYYAGGVQIIDIANPEHPTVVGSVGGNWVMAVAASGDTMVFYQQFSNYQQSMIYIMDLTDPVHPQYVGHYNTSEEMSDMEIYGSYLLTVSPNKFAVYQMDASSMVQNPEGIPKEFALYPCYPNPFNPSTVIRFTLPHTEHAKLIIYDVTGRQVKVLTNEVLSAGEHSVTFDVPDLSSGVYFVRLDAGHQMQTEKLVLLK